VDVTDADFDRAAAAGPKQAHKAAQQVPASRCFDSHAKPAAHEKAPAVRGLAASCDPLHNRGMEAAGIEPASRDVSERTSTRVSGRFEPRLRVPGRQGASQASPERFWPHPYRAMKRGESDLATAWKALPTGATARGYLIKQPERTELRQLKHGRLLTWPADQPRHAIRTSIHPVETSTPP
jgi:hypothetical protein